MKETLVLIFLFVSFSCLGQEKESYFKIDSIRESYMLNQGRIALYVKSKPLHDTSSFTPIIWSFYNRKKLLTGDSNFKSDQQYYGFIISSRKLKHLKINFVGYLPVYIKIDKKYRGKDVYITTYLADDTKPLI